MGANASRSNLLRRAAVTISTRYLHMRRQFAGPDSTGSGQREEQVIQYPSVHMRVIPQVVNAIVFITAGKEMVSRATGSIVTSRD